MVFVQPKSIESSPSNPNRDEFDILQKLDHHTDAKDPKKVKKQTNQQANTPTYTLKLPGLPIPPLAKGEISILPKIADSLEVFHPNLRIRSIHPSTCWGWIWLLQVDPSPISIHPSRVTGRRPEDHPSAALHGALQHHAAQLRMSQRQLHGGTRSNGATEEDDTSRGWVGFRPWKTPLFRCIY